MVVASCYMLVCNFVSFHKDASTMVEFEHEPALFRVRAEHHLIRYVVRRPLVVLNFFTKRLKGLINLYRRI